MSKNRQNSRIEDETKSNTERDNFTEGRLSCEDEELAQSLGDIKLDIPIDFDKVDEVHSTDHDEETMHDTSDHRTIFGLKIKHKVRIPSKRVSVPRLDGDWESLSELDVPIDHGKEINEISVASITDDNMKMRPWPVVLEPPPPPDPPNPY
ncbi:uncharacterized protein [Mytilus edulis]|uniref:uncharacterized protein n=1 Tax=Mytilus edulis TaxID=6550 RepID=UPI0039F09737